MFDVVLNLCRVGLVWLCWCCFCGGCGCGCIGGNRFMLCCVAGKVQDGQRECGFKSTATSGDWNPGVATTVQDIR